MSGADHEKLREAIFIAKGGLPARCAAVPSHGEGTVTLTTMEAHRLAVAAESTLPKTKMVQYWTCLYAFRDSLDGSWRACSSHYVEDEAGLKSWLRSYENDPRVSCIRVTGPHLQEVPV